MKTDRKITLNVFKTATGYGFQITTIKAHSAALTLHQADDFETRADAVKQGEKTKNSYVVLMESNPQHFDHLLELALSRYQPRYRAFLMAGARGDDSRLRNWYFMRFIAEASQYAFKHGLGVTRNNYRELQVIDQNMFTVACFIYAASIANNS